MVGVEHTGGFLAKQKIGAIDSSRVEFGGGWVLAPFAVDQAALLCSWGQEIVGSSAASNSVGRM